MKIDFIKNEDNLKISLDGRLDTITAPELESFINENIAGVNTVEIDCAKLTYVSSAGLRVLLGAQKKMLSGLKLTNVCELVMEVFEITGFVDVLTIE